MTTYSRGDVVLVPFPFAELTGTKRRPALVVSSDEYIRHNRMVVIAQITSKIDGRARVGDQKLSQWEEAGLLVPSLLRCHLATIRDTLILRKLGKLPASEMTAVERKLAVALGFSSE